MDEIASLQPGAEVNNDRLRKIFGCSGQGGMRRSNKTSTLVLICNHVESIYDDRWVDGVLHYTGMGQKGDQNLHSNQNRTLNESGSNGVRVHLFEVHTAKVYTYVGEVTLVGAPYQEEQTDEEGQQRKVWIFPIKPKTGLVPPISINIIRNLERRKERDARRLTNEEIEEKAHQFGRKTTGIREARVNQYQRNPYVAEHAKRRANGRCELCRNLAPFLDGDRPYLETHHIKLLARGGPDTIENTAALCPNCHRRMHVLDDPDDVSKLIYNVTGHV